MSDVEIDTTLLEATAGKWIVDKDDGAAPQHKRARVPRHSIIIGTSGSHDYLKDSTANQRFWPLGMLAATPAPKHKQSESARKADHVNTAEDPLCDGVHDTGAPPLYLCTRCFPYGHDAQSALDDREDDEDANQEQQETP